MSSNKKVKFFKDGDVNFSGVNLTVTRRKYQSVDQLCNDLNRRVNLPSGVRNIYTENGKRINSIDELEDGGNYICSSYRRIKKVEYKNMTRKKDLISPTPPLQLSSTDDSSSSSQTPPENGKAFFQKRKAKLLKLISKENTDLRTFYLLSPKIYTMETVLKEASKNLRLSNGQITGLFTLEGQEIKTVKEIHEGGDTYIAQSKSAQTSARSVPLEAHKSRPIEEVLNDTKTSPRKKTRNARNEPKKQEKKETVWLVTIYTSDIEDAGCDNDVHITLYGSRGKTAEHHLGIPGPYGYIRDSTNEAEMKVDDVGSIYKIRIGHDDNGLTLGWHLKSILLTNLKSNEEYVFECNQWLSREKDDSAIIRELSPTVKGSPILPTTTYHVKVYTGRDKNSGTDANVYLNLIGERGDSGKRLLYTSLENEIPFQPRTIDHFEIKTISLKELKQIFIAHDSSGEHPSWYLEKIVVIDESAKKAYYFIGQKWILSDEDGEEAKALIFCSDVKDLPLDDDDDAYEQVSVEDIDEERDGETLSTLDDDDNIENGDDHRQHEEDVGYDDQDNYDDDDNDDFEQDVDEDADDEDNQEEENEQTQEEGLHNGIHEDDDINDHEDEVLDEDVSQKLEKSPSQEPNDQLWQLSEESEVALCVDASGKYICYNNMEKKVHLNGKGRKCCSWTILNGKDVDTKLFYSANSNGYLAISDGKLLLTKGNPGLLNEFYIRMMGKQRIALESVVYSGMFINSNRKGELYANEESSFVTTFRIHAKGCLRDNTHVNIVESTGKRALRDKNFLKFVEDATQERCSFIVHKIGPEKRAFKNSVTERFLSINKHKKAKSVNTDLKDREVWFTIKKTGNEMVLFESQLHPGHYLAIDDKQRLTIIDDENNDDAFFTLKIVKAGRKARLKSSSPDCSPMDTSEQENGNQSEEEKPEKIKKSKKMKQKTRIQEEEEPVQNVDADDDNENGEVKDINTAQHHDDTLESQDKNSKPKKRVKDGEKKKKKLADEKKKSKKNKNKKASKLDNQGEENNENLQEPEENNNQEEEPSENFEEQNTEIESSNSQKEINTEEQENQENSDEQQQTNEVDQDQVDENSTNNQQPAENQEQQNEELEEQKTGEDENNENPDQENDNDDENGDEQQAKDIENEEDYKPLDSGFIYQQIFGESEAERKSRMSSAGSMKQAFSPAPPSSPKPDSVRSPSQFRSRPTSARTHSAASQKQDEEKPAQKKSNKGKSKKSSTKPKKGKSTDNDDNANKNKKKQMKKDGNQGDKKKTKDDKSKKNKGEEEENKEKDQEQRENENQEEQQENEEEENENNVENASGEEEEEGETNENDVEQEEAGDNEEEQEENDADENEEEQEEEADEDGEEDENNENEEDGIDSEDGQQSLEDDDDDENEDEDGVDAEEGEEEDEEGEEEGDDDEEEGEADEEGDEEDADQNETKEQSQQENSKEAENKNEDNDEEESQEQDDVDEKDIIVLSVNPVSTSRDDTNDGKTNENDDGEGGDNGQEGDDEDEDQNVEDNEQKEDEGAEQNEDNADPDVSPEVVLTVKPVIHKPKIDTSKSDAKKKAKSTKAKTKAAPKKKAKKAAVKKQENNKDDENENTSSGGKEEENSQNNDNETGNKTTDENETKEQSAVDAKDDCNETSADGTNEVTPDDNAEGNDKDENAENNDESNENGDGEEENEKDENENEKEVDENEDSKNDEEKEENENENVNETENTNNENENNEAGESAEKSDNKNDDENDENNKESDGDNKEGNDENNSENDKNENAESEETKAERDTLLEAEALNNLANSEKSE